LHVLLVGIQVGAIFALLHRRSERWGSIFVTVATVLAWLAPVHGILKPWYFFGGVLVAVGLANAVAHIRATD